MAKVQSFGGKGDANIQEAIDKISRTGGITVTRSIDLTPSQRRILVELVRIERGGGEATQSPGGARERRRRG
jgi:hypothetical protein